MITVRPGRVWHDPLRWRGELRVWPLLQQLVRGDAAALGYIAHSPHARRALAAHSPHARRALPRCARAPSTASVPLGRFAIPAAGRAADPRATLERPVP